MAATVEIRIFNGAGPTGANAESGFTFGRDDSVASTARIPKPNAAGTNYSWYKSLGLYVTAGGGSTSLSNRDVYWGSAPAAGLTGHFDPDASYVQATSGNKPTDNGTTNDATPASYTLMTTSAQAYDAASAAATNSTLNGQYCRVVIGVSNNYVGGAGPSIVLPDLKMEYDES